ncbi:uncharacterized protein METZ01_LOCUS138980 [marine metagenome]|uniref:Uncharacterized protein n=1 Tax=marine metagenome TaxID=408172 RepID=A0A381ZA08_9ZZZZ|tara:strand:- start:13700 stop:14449 length:750 start_codon:yes stop_codon:yes gene_type:complete
MNLNEGGNIFRGPDGKPTTQRINQADVDPTIAWLEKVTGLSLQSNKLGTTGIKSTSGDIDVAVDQNKITKDQLVTKLTQWAQANKQDPSKWIKKSGISVHFKTPINGSAKNGYVQTDLMFGDPNWMSWSLKGSAPGSNYTGADRHVFIASISKARGYKWSHKAGLLKRTTNEPVSKNPDEIASLLLGRNAKGSDLDSVENIHNNIKGASDYEELVADFRDSLAKIGKKLPEHVIEGVPVWFRSLINRIK